MLTPLKREDIFCASFHTRAESLSFSIEKLFEPLGIDFRGAVYSEAVHLSSYHPKVEKPTIPGVQIRKVH